VRLVPVTSTQSLSLSSPVILWIVFCRAWLGSIAPAWAWLGRAWARNNLEPGPGQRLRLGWAGLRLEPGLQTKKCSDEFLDNSIE